METIAHFCNFARLKQVDGAPEGWTRWSPRAEIAPRFSVDATDGRAGRGALRIESDSLAAFGAWRRRTEDIVGGHTYRFIVYYHARGVAYERRCVSARLDWLDENGERARPPDYALDVGKEGAWTKIEHVAPAPDSARSVVIELSLGWCPKGVVWWDDVRLLREPSQDQRVVRAATVYHRPRGTNSAAESVERFCRLVEAASSQKPDIICLPEGITVIGNGKSYAEVSEPIPGPTTQKLGALAKKLRCYIVAGIYENAGGIIYNTAVLIGRKGEVAGAYRKTHLPREEVEGGVDPTGSTLVEATPEHPIAVAELHLDRKIVQPWLGDMKTRTWKERRPDIPVQ